MHCFTRVVYLLHGLLLCQCLTVDEDVVALGKLDHLLRINSPSVVRQAMEAMCEMVAECCPQSEPLLAKFLDNPFEFPDFCFGKRDSSETWVRIRACAPVERIVKAVTTSQYERYLTILSQRYQSTDSTTPLGYEVFIIVNYTLKICTQEEIHSSICIWDHESVEEAKIKAHACMKKVLLKVLDEYGQEKYEEMVLKTKQHANYTIHDLVDAFSNQDV
ncbi:unnamed protein product [Rotaria sp. Silwood1]|nr:unnamed protein product [Rotaria sp. Silwood1]